MLLPIRDPKSPYKPKNTIWIKGEKEKSKKRLRIKRALFLYNLDVINFYFVTR
jgi:hypothetical protein